MPIHQYPSAMPYTVRYDRNLVNNTHLACSALTRFTPNPNRVAVLIVIRSLADEIYTPFIVSLLGVLKRSEVVDIHVFMF